MRAISSQRARTPADDRADTHRALHPLAQRRLEQIGVLDPCVDEDLAGRFATEVVLRQKSRQQLALLRQPRPREEIRAAKIAAATHEYDRDAVLAALRDQRDRVDVVVALRVTD